MLNQLVYHHVLYITQVSINRIFNQCLVPWQESLDIGVMTCCLIVYNVETLLCSNFCIIEGPETVQNFVQMQAQEIQDNIRSRRNKIFLLMEEVNLVTVYMM